MGGAITIVEIEFSLLKTLFLPTKAEYKAKTFNFVSCHFMLLQRRFLMP